METAMGAEQPLTLDQAINWALGKNDEILIERETVSAADGAVTEAKGAYDPVLALEAGWRRGADPTSSLFLGAPIGQSSTVEATEARLSVRQLLPTGGSMSFRSTGAHQIHDGALALESPVYDTQVGVEFRQPLLRDRSTDAARLGMNVAAAEHDEATASLRRTVSETVAGVERAYWALVAARQEVGVREEAVQWAEKQLAETRARFETGTVPDTELSQPRAELERRRGELLASREAVVRADNALKLKILGDDDDALWLQSFVPADEGEVDVSQVDVAAAMERALASRPELAAARAEVDRRRSETAYARNTVWPALDAVLSYDRFGLADGAQADLGQSYESLGDGDFDDTRIGLVLGIPLGNRRARGASNEAQSLERQAETDLARARKAIRAEVLDAAASLTTAGQRIEAARSAREAAEVQLDAEQERYSVGLSTNFLVLTRQNDLSRARLEEISVITDYRTARSEMARASGSLIDDRRIDVGGTTP
jgi:outer membrane protein TolC